MQKEIKPLYRKVNTKARGVHHQSGSDASYSRNTKKGISKSMKRNKERGLDYTPLYKFLLSKVGQDFDSIHSEAVSRLNSEDAIYHLVITNITDRRLHATERGFVICGDKSYYSALYIDDNNKLQKIKPELKNEDLFPSCWCCTHTFNETPFVKTWDDLNKKR